ncbi:RimJ/RimL family protein N-acetyltransferase [Micromonospora pisi]|uniref:RimJ/RimL family protein N-acetyltransferase n=1 Tax=Micromonospora pisi TaxID=589240 RepID=A0A495JP43_9ACTN|nr:GNAT family N-acetyltransferase [Micromonospora pisi]RKR90348.1 RimJ/RimL family protein N-acetyltransferase [Micromonospora pisi]
MDRETIGTDRVRLRLFRDSDTDALMAGCNDPLTRRFLPHLSSPYTEADAHWWISEGTTGVWARGGAAYAITDPVTDRLLGGIGIDHVVLARRQGEFGYWVAPWARGRGIATAATRALAERALSQGFARLELLTEQENVASQRVALASGFRREGIRRDAGTRPDGSRHDLLAWSRLSTDPDIAQDRLLPDLPGGSLTDGVVTLRPLTAADGEFVYELHSLPDVIAGSVSGVAPTRADVARRCLLAPARWLAGARADLLILDAASGGPAGEISLHHQESQPGEAMIGYAISPRWRRRGYPSRATRLLARWVFDHTGIQRLTAGTSPANLGSQRALEKSGFQREGRERGRLAGPTGQRVDALLFGLLPEDLESR